MKKRTISEFKAGEWPNDAVVCVSIVTYELNEDEWDEYLEDNEIDPSSLDSEEVENLLNDAYEFAEPSSDEIAYCLAIKEGRLFDLSDSSFSDNEPDHIYSELIEATIDELINEYGATEIK